MEGKKGLGSLGKGLEVDGKGKEGREERKREGTGGDHTTSIPNPL